MNVPQEQPEQSTTRTASIGSRGSKEKEKEKEMENNGSSGNIPSGVDLNGVEKDGTCVTSSPASGRRQSGQAERATSSSSQASYRSSGNNNDDGNNTNKKAPTSSLPAAAPPHHHPHATDHSANGSPPDHAQHAQGPRLADLPSSREQPREGAVLIADVGPGDAAAVDSCRKAPEGEGGEGQGSEDKRGGGEGQGSEDKRGGGEDEWGGNLSVFERAGSKFMADLGGGGDEDDEDEGVDIGLFGLRKTLRVLRNRTRRPVRPEKKLVALKVTPLNPRPQTPEP